MDELVSLVLGTSTVFDAVAIVKILGLMLVFECITGVAHSALNSRGL